MQHVITAVGPTPIEWLILFLVTFSNYFIINFLLTHLLYYFMSISREKFRVWGDVFDMFTERNLFKLVSQEHFDEDSLVPLSIGKEGNIFAAFKGEKKVIVKIYRLEACDFNRMYDYLKQDPRYQNLKKQRRKVVFAWCQREYRNLWIAREANVRVPMPIAFLYNILVMEFIGDESAALKIKDDVPKNKKLFFNEVIENLTKLYRGGLAHADLSAFNILNYHEKPVFIDFSQALPVKAPHAREYLERDVKNISSFFVKYGIKINQKNIVKKIITLE